MMIQTLFTVFGIASAIVIFVVGLVTIIERFFRT